MVKGYDLFEFFNGESVCPSKFVINTDTWITKKITLAYKEWIKKDLALLSLLIATLTYDVMDNVICCKTSHEVCTVLQEGYAFV